MILSMAVLHLVPSPYSPPALIGFFPFTDFCGVDCGGVVLFLAYVVLLFLLLRHQLAILRKPFLEHTVQYVQLVVP